ncbi:MAG: MFS transporter [Alphaproteobacteria bacterium]|nr:MFS transporter [Alphaproteobacteria bacterium]
MATEQHPTYSISIQSAVYSTAFFNGTVQSMASTIVALLVVALIDKNLALLVGVILASRQFLTVTMSVYSGTLMDNFGTKRVIIAFGVAGVLSALAYPSVSMIFGIPIGASLQNPGIALILSIIFIQMISGWSEATAWIGSQTLVGQLMKGHPVYAGRMTFVARIGGFLGPPAIGYAWDFWGPWGGFGFLAVWVMGGMIAASFLPDTRAATQASRDEETESKESSSEKETPEKQSTYGQTLRLLLIPAVAMVIMVTVMRQTGSGVQSSFYVVWLSEHVGIQGSTIGWLIGAANGASAIAALCTGPLMKRYQAHWVLILMVTISVVAIAITPMFGTTFSTLLFMALLGGICVRGFAQGLNLPLMMIILSRNVAPHLQGRVTALRISFNRFGGLLVPPGMGALADMDAVGGLANAFYIVGIAGVVALGALSLWVLFSPSFKKG